MSSGMHLKVADDRGSCVVHDIRQRCLGGEWLAEIYIKLGRLGWSRSEIEEGLEVGLGLHFIRPGDGRIYAI